MPLTVKTFLDKDTRDREYYELAKTHFDVMRYGDQMEVDNKWQIVWCIAHGSRIKVEPQRADSGIGELGAGEGEDAIFNPTGPEAETGIELGVVEGPSV